MCDSTKYALWYDQLIGVVNSGIINGPEYKIETFSPSSHPFLSSQPSMGQVLYNGQTFNVPILFDIYKDEVVVKHLTTTGVAWFIQLDKNFVEAFKVEERQFQRFDRGFHEVLFHRTDFSILADRSKIGQVRDQLFHYVSADQYFVIHSGHWHPLRSANAFSKILQTKNDKRAFKQFLNKEKIKIRRLNDDELKEVADFIYARLK